MLGLLRFGLFLLFIGSAPAHAEMVTRTTNGITDQRFAPTALVNGTIVTSPGVERTGQVLLLKDGRVEGLADEVPAGYRQVDLRGGYAYPGFVDFFSHYGMPEVGPSAGSRWRGPETLQSTADNPTNANEAIKAHLNAAELFKDNAAEAKRYRDLGFTTVLSFQADGIAQGTSAAVLTDDSLSNEKIIRSPVATHYSYSKGSSKQFFPVSRMGVVALLRQTHFDAEWFAQQTPRPFTDLSLDAYIETASLPKVIDAFDWKTILLSDRVGDELGHQFIIRSGGDEYQRIEEVKGTGATLIVDVNFPEAPDVADPALAEYVTLRQLKHWELAPYNLARVAEAEIPFVITSHGSEKHFWQNLKQAVAKGLPTQTALAALTETPARLMGLDAEIGRLQSGYLANLVVTDGPLFAEDSRIVSTWVRGQRFTVAAASQLVPGSYELLVKADGEEEIIDLNVSRSGDKYSAKAADEAIKVKLAVADDSLGLILTRDGAAANGEVWYINQTWQGSGADFAGNEALWQLRKVADATPEANTDEEQPSEPGAVIYPFVAHGYAQQPEQETLLIKNATLWTLEDEGVLEKADLLIKGGKIARVGEDISARGARIIDGTGLHVSPGIIDEHSHIALDGVNDFATNASMVRMADVVDSEDVGIYRALAGGVTAAQLLHGSANPIGGQSALIKMRWGSTPDQLLIEDADKFIKFALGENVKRSSNRDSRRYPQTRMGVEQVYVDAFTEARRYGEAWQAYEDLPRRQQTPERRPRRDLTKEALLEVVNSERFITSHSYVQSEINMLMRVAEQFDFRINTFTHILEGYKVADKMAAHGVGGSTFSDWWAYKWEVRYAIPYNAALMHNAGVVTAINSDDAEMLRRLNQEAAKSIRHGGMGEVDALKMVTLNPAKLLHLDDRMGSLKQGKDADLVIWSAHPLSVYSKPLTTLVDGRVYFDREQDAATQEAIRAERHRLVQKVLTMDSEKKSSVRKAAPEPGRIYYSHDLLHQSMDQAARELEGETP